MGAPPGNMNAVRAGIKSARVARGRRNRLHPELRKALLSTWPNLGQLLLEVGIGLFADHRGLRGYIDAQGGPVSTKGQVRACVEEMDRTRGRLFEWMRMANATGAKAEPESLAALLGQLNEGPQR